MGKGKEDSSCSAISEYMESSALLSVTGPPLRMQLPDKEKGFKFKENGDKILITPAKGEMMKYNDWEKEELPFRSMVLSKSTGEVLSAGFPKFFNYSEGADDSALSWQDEALVHAMEHEAPVYFTEKEDGSLLIRSVVAGQVFLRSRGSIDENNEHVIAMRAVAEKKYPNLLDPNFAAGHSLLLEFVSPQFRIVLPYEKDDLILVGAVDHHDLRLLDIPELIAVAEENDLEIMDVLELPRDPKELLETVRALEGHEGVVARCSEGQVLVKIKAQEYLTRHRLRFALTARVVRSVCEERDVESHDDFEAYLKEQGADWELVSDSRPLVETYIATRQQANKEYAKLKQEVDAKLKQFPERRDFAVKYANNLSQQQRPIAYALASGKPQQAKTILRNYLLDSAFDKLDAAEGI